MQVNYNTTTQLEYTTDEIRPKDNALSLFTQSPQTHLYNNKVRKDWRSIDPPVREVEK